MSKDSRPTRRQALLGDRPGSYAIARQVREAAVDGVTVSGGEPFEQPQYEALAALCAAIAQRYPIQHIAGHEHIAPGRKKDPGAGFDWRALQRSLGWPTQCFPR